MSDSKRPVGGGAKKILYTLKTAKNIGWAKSAKALRGKNTCKACGLGMGGQRGGMTNELGEFPSICNKSVQAQSTDIQPPIPRDIFEHSLDDFRQLSSKDVERLGRLGDPIFKSRGDNKFQVLTWDDAYSYIVDKFRATDPRRSFFYSSGRSSNEAGFVMQLFARMYGTNNINNCSYYCHQATGVGLENTIGTGTSTVEVADLDGCDLIVVIGANPASNHPRFIHKLKACRDRGGQVLVINPAKEPGLVKFALPKSLRSLIAGGSEIASSYIQPRIGGDIALLYGIAKWLLDNHHYSQEFIQRYTEGFSGFESHVQQLSWLEIERSSGVSRAKISEVAKIYSRAKNAVFAWGMGVTHHTHGVENVEAISNLALMRGMIGRPFAGLLPLRGHSNVQGIGSIGVKPILASEVIDRMEQTLKLRLSTDTNDKGLDTLACLEAAHAGEMDMAWIMGGNLFQATPDSNWADEALNRIPTKVYLTTTLNTGHLHGLNDSEALILPVLARDEEPQPTTQESMFNFVRMSDGGIDRIKNARSEIDIVADVASGVIDKESSDGFDFSVFTSRKAIRQTIAAVVPGMEQLRDIDTAKKEFHVKHRLMHTPMFRRDGGRAKFTIHSLPCLDSCDDFPLRLMSVRSEGQFNSIIYEEFDSYREVKNRWTVLMNINDTQRLQVKAGDKVDVISRHGSMRGLSVHVFDVAEGNLMAYYPEANVLIGRERDPRSKTPAFKSVAVNVIKQVEEC